MGNDTNTRVANPAAARFRNNARGFWGAYRWVVIVFLVSLFCDAASTIHFMVKVGPELEIHPMVRIAARIIGPVAGPLFGALVKALGGIVVAIYCRRFAPHILILASLISFWAAWYNIWGINMYNPMFMRWAP